MTREEALKQWLPIVVMGVREMPEVKEAVKMAITALEQQPSSSENPNKWIPCSERLPEIHQDVILSLRSLDIEIGFRAETEPYFYCYGADSCYIDPKDALAWMPLPEPYKVEGSDKDETDNYNSKR